MIMKNANILFNIDISEANEAMEIADMLSGKGYNLYASGQVANEFNKNFIATSVMADTNDYQFVINHVK